MLKTKYLLITDDELHTIWDMLCSSTTMEEIMDRIESRPAMQPLIDAMQEFVERCDRGEVRSIYTYAKFKDLLKTINNIKEENP
jgi:hypothetical protein